MKEAAKADLSAEGLAQKNHPTVTDIMSGLSVTSDPFAEH